MKMAMVLGGSWAGLIAARVIADHADDVVVLSTDQVDHKVIGAPHREQLHALLGMGHSQLERLFPGITSDIAAAGGHLGSGQAVRFYVDGILRVPVLNDRNTMIGASRTLIERLVRERVGALPNVRFLHGRATSLTVRNGRVSAVQVSAAAPTADSEVLLRLIETDLVVDAMGRSSRLGRWLEDEGWEPPPLQRLRIDLGYATATFRRGPELPDLVIAHAAPGPASGYRPTLCEAAALAAIEDDQWSVVVSGYGNHKPGRSPDQFIDRLKKSAPPFREIAEACEMTTEVTPFHFSGNQRRLFRKVARFPGGLIPIGDTVASVNPIYGQGLTLALLQSKALSEYLRSNPSLNEPATHYLQTVDHLVDTAWTLATTADLAQPHVRGPYPRGYSLSRWVSDKVLMASVIDPTLCAAFLDVLHMQRPPSTLARPALLARTAKVLAAEHRRTRRNPAQGDRTAD